MTDERIKIEVAISENDCIRLGYHAFWNRRGVTRNVIVVAFTLLLVAQSINEILADTDSYLYVYLLLILLIASPISIFTAHKGYYRRNFSADNKLTYTIDKTTVRVKQKSTTDKKLVSSITKITQNKKAIYLWWKGDYNATIIPKRNIDVQEKEFILSLVKKQ